MIDNSISYNKSLQHLARLLLVITILFTAFGLQKLEVDNSLSTWFSKNDTAFIQYQQFLHEFGSDEVIITVITDSSGFNTVKKLQNLADLTDSLSQIEGISRAISISHLPVIFQHQKVITLKDFIEHNTINNRLKQELKKLQHLKTMEQFLSNDKFSVTVYCSLDTLHQIEEVRPAIINKVTSLVNRFFPENKTYNGGTGVLYNAINQETIKESSIYSTLSFLILLLVFWLFTRRFRWLMLLVGVIASSLFLLFGIMGLLGIKVNMTIVALVPLVMVVSVAMLMHFYQHAQTGKTAQLKFNGVLKPVFYTTLTTAVGFLSLTVADMKITQEYGLMAGLGVAISFGFVLLFLYLFPTTSKSSNSKIRTSIISTQHIYSCMFLATKHKIMVIFTVIVVVFIAVIGIFHLKVDTDTFSFLPPGHKVIKDHQNIEQLKGGYLPLDFLVYPNDKEYPQDSLIKTLKAAQQIIAQFDFVTHSMSIADIKNDIRRLQSRQSNPFPFNSDEAVNDVAQQSKLVNSNHQIYRVSVYGPSCSARQLNERTDSILHVLQNNLRTVGVVKKSGYLPLYSQIIKNVLHDQLWSIGLALMVIFLLMAVLFRSVSVLLIAISANGIPIIILLGVMGLFTIWLDIGTVTIAAAMLGIIVDDTIHLLYYIQKYRKEGLSLQESLQNTAKRTGQAVVKTTIILVLGFGVLAFSSVSTLSNTGWLIALTAVFALLTDLILVPALLAFKKSPILRGFEPL